MEMKEFENMTIGELRKLTEDFLVLNPNFQSAEELMEELKNET